MLHPLQILRDRITDMTTYETGRFITHGDILLLQSYIPNILSYIPKINLLKRREGTTLNILDYDDTMHQRHHQLQLGILQDNRGLAGNRIIDEVIGRGVFLEKYYRMSSIVSRIAQILQMQDDSHQARVVTAGERTWQFLKTQQTGVYDPKKGIEIVSDARHKIQSIMQEVLSLGYIPAKIIIYDDKPEHFLKIAAALGKFLGGVEIVVNHVVLSQREVVRKQIAAIHQTIYTS